ncbi:MAG: hypothetical protein UCO57_09330 [Gemmiger sp.]|uniref:hypothetical protein n=1 Tax=Gemmiger sp. TaxID=2049027 RepID=UPI002E77F130|nr:hypothetical protein [Gemmiger sp.]MEE0708965.1 hypothetical protein [Gemmiger sp.]
MNGNWFALLLSLVSVGMTFFVFIRCIIEYKLKKYETKSENNESNFNDWKSRSFLYDKINYKMNINEIETQYEVALEQVICLLEASIAFQVRDQLHRIEPEIKGYQVICEIQNITSVDTSFIVYLRTKNNQRPIIAYANQVKSKDRTVFSMKCLHVTPCLRQKGIGRIIMRNIIPYAQFLGCDTIQVIQEPSKIKKEENKIVADMFNIVSPDNNKLRRLGQDNNVEKYKKFYKSFGFSESNRGLLLKL